METNSDFSLCTKVKLVSINVSIIFRLVLTRSSPKTVQVCVSRHDGSNFLSMKAEHFLS